MTTPELAAAYAALAERSASSTAAAKDFLRFCRVNRAGAPAVVHDAAARVLGAMGAPSSLEDFALVEQAVVAGLASGGARAEAALSKQLPLLQRAFPASVRVARLLGMRLESAGDTDAALEAYDAILEDAPTHAPTWRRKVAAMVAAGRDADAVAELGRFLLAFGADVEAWLEMAELQLALGRAAQAAFCLEEVLLCSPASAAAHARLAEVLGYVGSRDALRNARLHACEAVRLTSSPSVAAAAPPSSAAAGAAGSAATAATATTDVTGASGWALTLLADVSYLHWCRGVVRKPAGRSFLTKPRSGGGGSSSSAGAAASGGAGGVAAAASSTSTSAAAAVDALLGGSELGWGGRTIRELAALADDLLAAGAAAAAASDAPPAAAAASGAAAAAAAAAASDARAAMAKDGSLAEDVALHALALHGLRSRAAAAAGAPPAKAAAVPRPTGVGADAPAPLPLSALHAACLLPFNIARLAAQAEAMQAAVAPAATAAASGAGGAAS